MADYRACPGCDWWVTADEASCLGCGVARPFALAEGQQTLSAAQRWGLAGAAMGSAAGGLFHQALIAGWPVGAAAIVVTALGGIVGAGGAAIVWRRWSEHIPDVGVPRWLVCAAGVPALGALLGVWGSATIAGRSLPIGWMSLGLPFIACAVGAVVGLALAGVAEERSRGARGVRRALRSLDASRALIAERLESIDARLQRAAETLEQIAREDDSERWQAARRTVEAAMDATRLQGQRYQVLAWRIELARWLNRIEPLTDGLHRLGYDDCTARLETVDELVSEGEGMHEEWDGIDAEGHGEVRSFIERAEDALATCDRLRQSILARQALAVAEQVAPVADAVAAVEASPPAPAPKDLSGRIAAADLFTSVDTLEAEYQRLASEQQAVAEVAANP